MASTEYGTRPLLRKAAKTIVETLGLADTMVDVLRARAFQPYSEGLRQYLIIRLGSERGGEEAFAELRAVFAGESSSHLFEEPGLRAQLYKIARRLAEKHLEELASGPIRGRGQLPWRKPVYGVSDRYRWALAQIRAGLPAGLAELLELRYARELEPSEIAHVLGVEPREVEQRLDIALAQVRELLSGHLEQLRSGLETLLLEAFAIECPDGTRGFFEGADLLPLKPGVVLGGRYEIKAQVGSGGMGNVYRARDTQVPGHEVALKLLHRPALSQASRQAALRELHLIASVFHPSVVQFKDHGWYEDRFWFVMPWYEGETLQVRMEREPLTRSEARPIFEQLALALSTMHSGGIRHQDIKPDNILLARLEGVGGGGDDQVLPVLLDLGVAAKEAELVLAGTPVYFAPEVAAQYARVAEPHPVSAAADVFSLCLSLRNALEPHTRVDVPAGAVERFIEHRAGSSPAPPNSKDLRYLKSTFERWLNVDPEKRPTAAELAAELRVLTAPEERRARWLGLARWLTPLLVALVAIFGSVVFALSQQTEFQKLEAERARIDADHARVEAQRARLKVAGMQEDLSDAEAREKALEQDVAQTLKRYESSELTREELTGKLARAEGQSRMFQEMYGEQKRSSETYKLELDKSQDEGRRLRLELSDVRSELSQETEQVKTLSGEVASLEVELASTLSQVKAEQQRSTELGRRIDALEGELNSEISAKQRLLQDLASAEADRNSVRAELQAANRRIEQLENTIRALRQQAPPTVPEPPGRGIEGGNVPVPRSGKLPASIRERPVKMRKATPPGARSPADTP